MSHLYGIVFAPLLHASFGHLIANTTAFALLGLTIALVDGAIAALASGVGAWLTAPAGSVTLGASGVVFSYATYLISRGMFKPSQRGAADEALTAARAGAQGPRLLAAARDG